VSYVSREKYIYFWDWANYFTFFIELGQKITHTPLKAIDSVFVSIRKADYNLSGVVPLMPFYLLFGSGRMSYITAITVMYVVPAVLIFPSLIRTISRSHEHGKDLTHYALLTLTMVLLPQIWAPVFLGYIDVAGLALIFLILIFYFRKDLPARSTKELIALGVMLALLVILRRWYAYWVVGFFTAMIVDEAIRIVRADEKRGTARTAVRNIMIVAGAALVSLVAFATHVTIRMATTNYADIYSADRSTEGLSAQLQAFSNYFGWMVLGFAVLGAAVSFSIARLRRRAAFLLVIFVTAFALFLRTQDLDYHHYYWVLSIVIVFVGVFLQETYGLLRSLAYRMAFVVLIVVLSGANFAAVFVPDALPPFPLSAALSKSRLYPKSRDDLNQIRALLLGLNDELNQQQDPDGKVYVLSSSVTLNSSLLQNAAESFEPELRFLRKRILNAANVDKRDGFPFQIYTASFVVVTNPPGYHLAHSDQRVVGLLAEYLLSGRYFGAAFSRQPGVFTFSDGSEAYIYRKHREFKAEELTQVSDIFVKYYPEHRHLFEITPEKIREYGE
jgi:hypothetical protein